MSPWVHCAILALLPAVSLWASWPRRRWAAAAVLALSAIFWALGMLWMPEAARLEWIGVGGWSLAGGFCAMFVVRRNEREYRRLDDSLRGLAERHASLSGEVAQTKARGAKTEEAQREAQALYGMIKGLSEALSWEDARPKLELAVQQYLGLDEFALYISDLQAPNALHPLVTRRLGASVGGTWDTLSRYLQERNVPLTRAHALESPERAVAAPIRDSSEMMGYFYGRVPAGGDSKALLDKVTVFVEEIAFALRRVKLFQELESLSQIDGLTGIFRRGVLDQRLREEVVRARTFKTSFCFLLLDVDHFKKLNDAYGHPFGDQVLRRVGEILKASVYETDFVARYGGEEFAVLLPRAEPAGVLRKAQAIRTAVESETFTLALQTVRVTVSIGVAHYPRDGQSPEAIIQRADQALYYAKESGRNCVVDIIDVPAQRLYGRTET